MPETKINIKMDGLSILPSVYPLNVTYPHAANIMLIDTASETDTCVMRDQLLRVGSSKEPYIKKLLWWQMNAETHMAINSNHMHFTKINDS